jgi:hypothetical protein
MDYALATINKVFQCKVYLFLHTSFIIAIPPESFGKRAFWRPYCFKFLAYLLFCDGLGIVPFGVFLLWFGGHIGRVYIKVCLLEVFGVAKSSSTIFLFPIVIYKL